MMNIKKSWKEVSITQCPDYFDQEAGKYSTQGFNI
jgi:hypothetical protein